LNVQNVCIVLFHVRKLWTGCGSFYQADFPRSLAVFWRFVFSLWNFSDVAQSVW